MNYTENLALNLWDPDDKVLRTDFNADNAKLDAAIKAVEDKADMKANQSALTWGTGRTPKPLLFPKSP